METVALTAADGVRLAADYYPSAGAKFALLLHMMPATKESWRAFAAKLVASGFNCLALDERGHGQSTMDGTLDYKKFSNEEQQAKNKDVEAAFEFLHGKGATEQNTVVIGASIGANLAIQFLCDHPGVPMAVALSPGLDYHGVLTQPAIAKLKAGQTVILVASDDDKYSASSVEILHEVNPDRTKRYLESGLGHGTRMTDKKPALIGQIIADLKQAVSQP